MKNSKQYLTIEQRMDVTRILLKLVLNNMANGSSKEDAKQQAYNRMRKDENTSLVLTAYLKDHKEL